MLCPKCVKQIPDGSRFCDQCGLRLEATSRPGTVEDEKEMTILSFVNFKGGVGKTATAVNVASDLAKYHEAKTLLVDLDPQSNTSMWVMTAEKLKNRMDNEKTCTVYQLFRDHTLGTHDFDFDEAVVKSPVQNPDGTPLIPNLDLLPATYDMVKLEHEIATSDLPDRFSILEKELQVARREYKYIVIDCAPNIYWATRNALFFSDFYIVPVIPDYLAQSGLQILAQEVRKYLDIVAHHKRNLVKLSGVLMTRVDKRSVDQRLQKGYIENALRELKSQGTVDVRARIFATDIRNSIKVQESIARFLPLCEYDSNHPVAEDFRLFTDELVRAVGQK